MIGPDVRITLASGPRLRMKRVRCAIVRHELDVPMAYGRWRITHREFALVRVDTADGVSGFSYGLTREGPVAEVISRVIAPVYEGAEVDSPADLVMPCRMTNHSVLAAGTGMRALSLVDMAVWDAMGRLRGVGIARLIGGEPTPRRATSIVGYPPTMGPEALADEITGLRSVGWRRFKAPVSASPAASVARMSAARQAAGGDWLGFDLNYSGASVDGVVDLERQLRHLNLGWLEDVVAPGDAGAVAEVRRRTRTPVASGDDQGGAYFPEALLNIDAFDVLRVDMTTSGGLTGLPAVLTAARNAGVAVAPHMFPHFHTRAFDGLRVADYPAEWGIPGAGVHPMDDALEQPVLNDGVMNPLADEPGFGRTVNLEWLRRQQVFDPLGVLDSVPEDVCA
ncbi:MAG: mandelate racemase/muconate lactonizing enzyme family protein [Candidatus Nanopelagicales bacterium]